MHPQPAPPYGLWQSPITPAMIADSLRLDALAWDGDTLIWLEKRGQRGVLVGAQPGETPRDLTDSQYSISGGVGYGGGEFTARDGMIVFSSGGRLYRIDTTGSPPQVLTPGFGAAASPTIHPNGVWIAFVHTYEGRDVIAAVDAEGRHFPLKLTHGDDFYMQPTWSPDGKSLAFIAWNQPQMPWNGSELRVMSLEYDPRGLPLPNGEEIIAGDQETAIFQPAFSPDGRFLSYISDANGWGQIILRDIETGTEQVITEGTGEHGQPAWVQGLSRYAWTPDSAAIYYLRGDDEITSLWVYDIAHATSIRVHELGHYTAFKQLAAPVDGPTERVAMVVSSTTTPTRVVTYDAEHGPRILRYATTEQIPQDRLSEGVPITWDGRDGGTVHGLFYAPTHPQIAAEGLPPLIVNVHGGPTSQEVAEFDLETQFFTSRGYAVLHVNHRGSTGYGKAYLNQLQGNWGIFDVEDSVTGAQHLATSGLVDARKRVIMGGSAGGYTTLLALVKHPGFFTAGISRYGVADLFQLAIETHKFEAKYNDWLLGPLPGAADAWRERSPLTHADQIRDPLLIFQGTEDAVVPKNQSDQIVAAVRRNGVPCEYHVYEGEGHGFRKPETKIDYYKRILAFLERYVIYR